MPSFSETRNRAVVAILNIIKAQNPTFPVEISFSDVARRGNCYAAMLGRKEVLKGITADLANSGYYVERYDRNKKIYFKVKRRK